MQERIMMKRMNKKEVLNLLKERTGLTEDECLKVNELIESNFIVGRKSKEKIISLLQENLCVDAKKVDDIYNAVMEIIASGIKEKLKHPFKDLDR